jgi:thioredoxin-disulfide reductase
MLDVVIIGAGPAGMTCALYASRAGASVMILDKGAPGGKMNLTASIENYPGADMKGPQLAYAMYEQSMKFGAKMDYKEIVSIEKKDDYFVVKTNKEEIETKNVVLASGTKERLMNIELEEELTGRGVSYCAVCDGPFFKNKDVAVVGGGNSALEESLYLSTIVNKVHLIVRRDVFRADEYFVNKINECENIEVHFLKKPHKIIEENKKVAGLVVEDSQTQELTTINVQGIFPFIGLDPLSELVKSFDVTNEQGYVLVDENMETTVKGLFAIGDVRDKTLRQVVTATNDGAIAGQYIASQLR